ncbi:VCBS repeat-containing protein [Marinoscillum sp.]|uniref:VCBS repeat-containing protein n=1 Tax=Marinoscillum sp. TaxID=2024838 RepID=UPI003BAC6467
MDILYVYRAILKNIISGGLIFLLIMVSCQTLPDDQNNPTSQFRKVSSSQSGITFQNSVEEKFENFFDFFAYVYNGGGVAIGDINNDGLPDIYFTGNEISNRLYLNLGQLKFKDITESAGVSGGKGWHNGVTMIDLNHDGLLDIYVCRGGWQDTDEDRANLLYINQGDLTFKEEASHYGLDEKGYSMHASFFDIDNDLDLDVFIINRPDSFYLPLSEMYRRQFSPPEHSRDKLYVNEGGRFIEKGKSAGIINNYGYGLSVVTADIDQDGWTDIYISNDYSVKDYLYINQQDGTFKEEIQQTTNHISLYSMGADIADINNDGLEDLLVMEMRPEDYERSKISMPSMDVKGFYSIVDAGMHKQYMHNMLHLNQGNRFFSEVAQYAGISKTDWSWACLASDFDNDGYRDLFVSNGMRRDLFDGDVQTRLATYVNDNREQFKTPDDLFGKGFEGIINTYKPVKVRNYLYRNTGELKYENVSELWGFQDSSFSHGAAVADLDNDGDLDIVINNLEDKAFLYENTSNGANSYLKINLKGPDQNPAGLGAKIKLHYGDQEQYFEQKTVRGYLSSHDPMVHFGLGQTQQIDSLSCLWADGKVTRQYHIPVNQTLTVAYAQAVAPSVRDKQPIPLFERHKMDFPFIHHENDFNEFTSQVLLPHMFSRKGPFFSVADVTGDGLEDFYVGGASGQAAVLYVQQSGTFQPKVNPIFLEDKFFEDMGSSFFDADMDGDMDLVVVSGGSEHPESSEWYQTRLYLNDGSGSFKKGTLPPTTSSGSVVVPHDFDNDGDIDLFIGGQVIANKYPLPPSSFIFVNEGGTFKDKTQEIAPALSHAGMINAAAWVDLTGDQQEELVVVGEWTPVLIFQYTNNTFREISDQFGLKNMEGWWNSVEASDLDQDGDMDLILGNLGENYKFHASAEKPLEVFANDYDLNGTNDIFLAKYNNKELVPVRGKECSSQQIPLISQKFPTFESFAHASLEQILGGAGLERAFHLKAHIFSSIILRNNSGKLEVVTLPKEAQFSTVNAIIPMDFDQDGIIDLLMAGNHFDTEVETTPADASPGYFLKGIGNLTYRAIPPMESGFFVPYNVKDACVITTPNGPRVLTTANNDSLRIFHINPPVPNAL